MANVLSFSEVGGHRHNEDAFVVLNHPLDEEWMLCFVADGQGGQAGGGPAARLACAAAAEYAATLPPDRLADRLTWAGIVRKADAAVEADAVAGFTTFVAVGVKGDRIVGASCGDSAAVLVTDAGGVELTEGQRKNPPVGSGVAPAVAFEATGVPPWQLLVMTDGVWKYVGWEQVVAAARRERGAALIAALREAARVPGTGLFQDDFTVVLVE